MTLGILYIGELHHTAALAQSGYIKFKFKKKLCRYFEVLFTFICMCIILTPNFVYRNMEGQTTKFQLRLSCELGWVEFEPMT